MDNMNFHKYPYKPDILMGYQGQKLGIFILPENNILIDTNKPDGETLFRMRLLERKHAG